MLETGTDQIRSGELHPVHADSHEIIARIFDSGSNIGKFVHPFKQVAAKKEAVVIQVFRQDETVVFHGFTSKKRWLYAAGKRSSC